MKRIAVAAALVLSAAAFSAAWAASDSSSDESSAAQSDDRTTPSWGDDESRAPAVAEGFLNRFRHDERDGHRRHHWDDDDDDDEGSASADSGRARRPADPNAANAPVPDSGVFNGKARPKVEVQ